MVSRMNDGGADGNDIRDAHGAERDQQREGSFGTVCGRTQRVKAEDGDAGGRANALAVFRRGC